MIDRREFTRLLDAYTSAYAAAVLAFDRRDVDYEDLAQASLRARLELEQAILGELP